MEKFLLALCRLWLAFLSRCLSRWSCLIASLTMWLFN